MNKRIIAILFLVPLVFVPSLHSQDSLTKIWEKEEKFVTKAIGSYLKNDESLYGKRTIQRIAFYDLDHTLVDTDLQIPIYLEVSGKRHLSRLVDSKCMGIIAPEEIPDYSIFNRKNLYDSGLIQISMEHFRRDVLDPKTLTIVLTARSDSHNFFSIREKLAVAVAEPDHVLPVNSNFFQNTIWNTPQWKRIENTYRLPKSHKKPILIAAVIDYYLLNQNKIDSIAYYEDTDSYFKEAMHFLTDQYPTLHQEYFDILRKRRFIVGYTYTLIPILISQGRKIHESHSLFPGWEKLREYDSGDCP